MNKLKEQHEDQDLDPHAALLAYSSFGYPEGERSTFMREAVDILDKRNVDFDYDGEMAADVALNPEAMKLYPFCRLTEPANVLIMPAIHSASISTKLLQELGGATLVGLLMLLPLILVKVLLIWKQNESQA